MAIGREVSCERGKNRRVRAGRMLIGDADDMPAHDSTATPLHNCAAELDPMLPCGRRVPQRLSCGQGNVASIIYPTPVKRLAIVLQPEERQLHDEIREVTTAM